MGEPSIRDRILFEATRLFADRGYGSVAVREVVEAAEVTKPTLYYYFTNKEALFLEAVRSQTDGLRQAVLEGTRVKGSTRDRLRGFIVAYMDWMLANASGVRLLMAVHHHPDPDQPPVDMVTAHRENGRLLAEILHEGQAAGEVRPDLDLNEAVMALVGMLNFRCAAAIQGTPIPQDMPDRMLALFFHGINP